MMKGRREFIAIGFAFFCFLGSVFAHEGHDHGHDEEAPATDSKVKILTSNSFTDAIAGKTVLVEFYAPWCGHCKRLAPTWEELATKASFDVAKVDCTVETEVCKVQGVRGYPTIKLFTNGTPVDFQGPRTIDSFLKFVEDKAEIKSEL